MENNNLAEWLATAATFSRKGTGVNRFFLTREHRQLINWLEKLMKQCGLDTHLDDSGNLIGRRNSAHSSKVLYLGSHQDTVANGGAYDGILGILVSLAAICELKARPLPFSIEILAFGDEEGARFNTTLLGSKAISGFFSEEALGCRDQQGKSLYEALVEFGLTPENIPQIARNPLDALGFIEVHIEQGPILDRLNLPVGLVTSITGIERHSVCIHGKAGHAGTVPMLLRKDALVAASRIVTWLDSHCRTNEETIGVVGKLDIVPNCVNVIPETADLTVELRSPKNAIRREAREALGVIIANLRAEGYMIESKMLYSQESVKCDQEMTTRLENAILKEAVVPTSMFSGAGHDGLAMVNLCPISMLFVRCKDGLSHHPDESVETADTITAKNVLKTFILDLASDLAP